MNPAAQRTARLSLALLALAVALPAHSDDDACGYDDADDAAVRAAIQAYVRAWLANDAEAVMATLTDDIVLQPHHGDEPVIGAEAVRAWWFPEGPPATITEFAIETEATEGCGSLAYAWGRFSIEWQYEDLRFTNAGNTLSVLERTPDGWRIAHQTWNDPEAEVMPL